MSNIYDLDTPTLLVNLDRMERNITGMASVVSSGVGGKRLRPHVKTHKIPEIAKMQLAAGAQGITVAKLGEAEVFVNAGIPDVFIGNQIVGSIKLDRLFALAERGNLCVAVDSLDVAEPIGSAACAKGTAISVMLEVDTGLGRAGTRSVSEALSLARSLSAIQGLDFKGIFTHEGHLYSRKDGVDPYAAARVAEDMRTLASMLADQGTPAHVVSVGSTPGAKLLANEPGLTEMRPGVYVFSDRSQVRRGADPNGCALSVLATVTSIRSDGRVLVDAGTKSLASDCPFEDRTYGEILGRPEISVVGASEEHGHLLVQGETDLKVGMKLQIIPNHACTCVNMHNTLTAYRGEQVETVWNIAARGAIR